MLWVAGWAVVAGADVRMSKLFTDHMVLQRDMDVPAWGWAEPNEKVTVQIAGQTVSATADAKGNWLVKLAALKAGGPYELVVTGKTALTLKDVLVGDVWVCAGQSNMEWPLVNTDTSKEAIAAATNSQIRLLSTKGPQTPEPEMTVPGPWAVCSPQTVVGFSAVGYHFGRILQEKVNIPIGLINIAWGGTAIELWLHPDSLAQVEELSGVRANYEKRMAEYQQQLDKSLEAMSQWVQEARESKAKGERIRPPKAEFPAHPAMGGIAGIYNGRVASLTSYGIKGAIWYQGESNGTENDLYYHKMRALVGGWRKVWNQGDFPFYFVQLANFTADNNIPAGGDGYAKIRMAQLKSLQIPHTGMAVAIDIGLGNNIHPTNKEDVGYRLAAWALKNDYGQKDLVCSGPLFKEMKVADDKIRISFDYAANGLIVGKKEGHGPALEDANGNLKRFAIAGADKKWFWADAVIEGSEVVVSCAAVPSPVAVRYAFSANPEGCNLYNKEGLPASPFRTDTW